MTDGHRHIGKWIVENYDHICPPKFRFIRLFIYFCCHLYDIWHVTNCESNKMQGNFNMYRPLSTIFILFMFPKLSSWSKKLKTEGLSKPGGVATILYWALISNASGDGELIVKIWKSIERHVQKLDRSHGDKPQRCAHWRLRGKHRQKSCIKPDMTEFQYCPMISPVGQSVWKVLG